MDILARLRKLPPSVHRPLISSAKVPYRAWITATGDLNRLARFFHTDKWGKHWYTQHYERYLRPIRNKRLNLLEIGVGGYTDKRDGGQSLRMWKAYFPKARIVGVDLEDKRHFRQNRIDIWQFDQTDAKALTDLSTAYGGFDIIVDDGSHLNEHVIATFKILFPLLRPNGIYAIEDTETAYWPTWGGGLGNPNASTEFFKKLTDGLNYIEYPVKDYDPNYFDKNIIEIAFFHALIIIRKGDNSENPGSMPLLRRELEAAARGRVETWGQTGCSPRIPRQLTYPESAHLVVPSLGS